MLDIMWYYDMMLYDVRLVLVNSSFFYVSNDTKLDRLLYHVNYVMMLTIQHHYSLRTRKKVT